MLSAVNVLAITGTVPFRRHDQPGVTAAHIVTYELINALKEEGHTITLQVLFNEYRKTSTLTQAEERELAELSRSGVQVLPPIGQEAYRELAANDSLRGKFGRVVRFIFGLPVLLPYYPSVRAKGLIGRVIESIRPGVVLTIWSPEAVAATHGIDGVPRVAYHGDIDFAPFEQRMRDKELFVDSQTAVRPPRWGGQLVDTIRQRFRLAEYKRAHMAMMSQLDVIANVAASNAKVYAHHGHARSIYIRNVWSDHAPSMVPQSDRSPTVERPIKIIGHVGYLTRTGSIYGLRFLLKELLPQLDDVMKDTNYEVHVIGGGELPVALRPYAAHGRIRMRGYVKDLDLELNSSDVYLLLNNAGPYRAAYTRHILAWQMGLCLIVHENSREAIPEIRHEENALVGSSPRQIAELIRLAAVDTNVNRKVRAGGRSTYQSFFAPRRVAAHLSEEIRALAKSGAAGTPSELLNACSPEPRSRVVGH